MFICMCTCIWSLIFLYYTCTRKTWLIPRKTIMFIWYWIARIWVDSMTTMLFFTHLNIDAPTLQLFIFATCLAPVLWIIWPHLPTREAATVPFSPCLSCAGIFTTTRSQHCLRACSRAAAHFNGCELFVAMDRCVWLCMRADVWFVACLFLLRQTYYICVLVSMCIYVWFKVSYICICKNMLK